MLDLLAQYNLLDSDIPVVGMCVLNRLLSFASINHRAHHTLFSLAAAQPLPDVAVLPRRHRRHSAAAACPDPTLLLNAADGKAM